MTQKKKVLFIDRDGTLLKEPADEQIDAFEKMEFVQGAITALAEIREKTDFELVMVSNQDGLGTPAYPYEDFLPTHNFMKQTLKGEGVIFDAEYIDPHFPEDNAPTRKPGTAMLTKYFSDEYDLAQSFVIGDRDTDRELAKNLGCTPLILSDKMNWKRIAEIVIAGQRVASVHRKTKETDIDCSFYLDQPEICNIDTGLGFFDHMLEQIPHHGQIGLKIKVKGDLRVDEHHTIEDTALTLGECMRKAIGNKVGMLRYGYCLPMDDCMALVSLDFGGRPWLVWNAEFKREKVGDMPTEMFFHFFKSISDTAQMNLHIQAEGTNEHHKIEAIFKAFARALRMALARDTQHLVLPSSKGVL